MEKLQKERAPMRGMPLQNGAAYFFSPRGRRWPEGSDEGASSRFITNVAPSSRCRGLLPLGEKKLVAPARP